MQELIKILNLSVLLVSVILSINLIGTIFIKYLKTKNLKIRSMQKNFIYLFILFMITFVSGFLRYTLDENYVVKFYLFMAIFLLGFYLIVSIRFWKFLDKKIVFLNFFFGVIILSGIIGNLVENIIAQIVHMVGLFGLIVSAPLSIIKILINNSEGEK